MHTAGLALFLYAAVAVSNANGSAVVRAPATVIVEAEPALSPDPAPPHPLTPRVPAAERPPATIMRLVFEVARAALQSHGH